MYRMAIKLILTILSPLPLNTENVLLSFAIACLNAILML